MNLRPPGYEFGNGASALVRDVANLTYFGGMDSANVRIVAVSSSAWLSNWLSKVFNHDSSLRHFASWLSLLGRPFGRSAGPALLYLALNRGVDANDRVAGDIEELVQPQNVLARGICFPRPHRVLGLPDVRQPAGFLLREHFVEQARDPVAFVQYRFVFGS